MGERCFKDYIQLACRDLNLEYKDVMNMTFNEINEISKKRFASTIEERMKDENFLKTISLLFPLYDTLVEHFGELYKKSLCMSELSSYVEEKNIYQSDIEKLSEEEKKYLIKKSTNYSSDKKICLKSYNSVLASSVSDAILLKYPFLSKYGLSVSYYDLNKHAERVSIHFNIPFEDNGKGEIITTEFDINLRSFICDGIDDILENYLDSICFYDADDEKYKKINNFLSSKPFTEFWECIKQTREPLET